jgi:SAM-dependent methyltransferase
MQTAPNERRYRASPGDLWRHQTSQWHLIRPPLRPSPEDIELVENIIAERFGGAGPFRALLLGVTPELALMNWPPGARLVAVDRSPAMIRGVWPSRNPQIPARAICADWERLPMADGTMTTAAGDGFNIQLAYPDGYLCLGKEIRRVLHPGGILVMRAFVRPAREEDPDDVFRALSSKKIGNFHAFKLRLAMSLQDHAARGVSLADIWAIWRKRIPDPDELARATRWPAAEIRTIDAYRDSGTRYSFPNLGELREALRTQFRELECLHPGYELGDRCPTLVLRAR